MSFNSLYEGVKDIPVGFGIAALSWMFHRIGVFPMTTIARELQKDEFPLAEAVWEHYRQQKADPVADRIFGVFVDGRCVGVARCKKHTDGLEVDGVFTLEEFRGKGLADLAVGELVKNCGKDVLFMHSTLVLVRFYKKFGWKTDPRDRSPGHDQGAADLLPRGDGRVQRRPDAPGSNSRMKIGEYKREPIVRSIPHE